MSEQQRKRGRPKSPDLEGLNDSERTEVLKRRAAIRKRKQRQKQKIAGMKNVSMTVSGDVFSQIHAFAKATNRTFADACKEILERGLAAAESGTRTTARDYGELISIEEGKIRVSSPRIQIAWDTHDINLTPKENPIAIINKRENIENVFTIRLDQMSIVDQVKVVECVRAFQAGQLAEFPPTLPLKAKRQRRRNKKRDMSQKD